MAEWCIFTDLVSVNGIRYLFIFYLFCMGVCLHGFLCQRSKEVTVCHHKTNSIWIRHVHIKWKEPDFELKDKMLRHRIDKHDEGSLCLCLMLHHHKVLPSPTCTVSISVLPWEQGHWGQGRGCNGGLSSPGKS